MGSSGSRGSSCVAPSVQFLLSDEGCSCSGGGGGVCPDRGCRRAAPPTSAAQRSVQACVLPQFTRAPTTAQLHPELEPVFRGRLVIRDRPVVEVSLSQSRSSPGDVGFAHTPSSGFPGVIRRWGTCGLILEGTPVRMVMRMMMGMWALGGGISTLPPSSSSSSSSSVQSVCGRGRSEGHTPRGMSRDRDRMTHGRTHSTLGSGLQSELLPPLQLLLLRSVLEQSTGTSRE